MRKSISKLLPQKVKKLIKLFLLGKQDIVKIETYPNIIKCYGQYYEDLLVDAILNCPDTGIYVDVGAHHPSFLSNTLRFYLRGWSGINIEPNPNLIKAFAIERSRDINLNLGVSNKKGFFSFYELGESTLSSFNYQDAIENTEKHHTKIVNEYKVKVTTLKEIFETHIGDKQIDFLSIDTEGLEIQVLEGNDWKMYKPKLIIIEVNDNQTIINDFLMKQSYLPIIFNGTNALYFLAERNGGQKKESKK